MILKRVLGIAICLTGSFAFAQNADADADPVLRAKAQRAFNNNQDLPPIPRGLTEPPPLPPPELHTHDIKAKRRSYAIANSKSKKTASVKKNNAGTTKTSVKKTPAATNKAAAKPSGAPAAVKKARK
ncbi:MAG: hypothetical protein LBB40_02615 [Holophagales bacterium]|jgi:hypothetical protein|nr:hypothetical protein [Holophagales bacterium]